MHQNNPHGPLRGGLSIAGSWRTWPTNRAPASTCPLCRKRGINDRRREIALLHVSSILHARLQHEKIAHD
ncbi:hypothetical protein B0T18DRAFT_415934 [Schizothecium vesticola]|uniref:Uncharacterized protein n=1 Tax=Schizothecium vesticola TaxID=314040 RepID=A0AA40EQX3_9PEZI|nr:hypothetical protein B0T18DRAFT_415934 [Schizothecium vesticola]